MVGAGPLGVRTERKLIVSTTSPDIPQLPTCERTSKTAAKCHLRIYGPQQNQVLHGYSITSSARARRVGGTSMPSALAVLRLITSSYLVGA